MDGKERINRNNGIANDKPKKHGLLFDIDSLFDTRLAIYQSMNRELIDKLMMTSYYTRDRDDLEGFDVHEFRERYRKRDIGTLMQSRPTNNLMYLYQTISQYTSKSLSEGKVTQPELILNIYPYQLNYEEIDVFVRCLKYYMGSQIPVSVINKSPSEITPAYLDDNAVGFYTYEWYNWLTLHWVPMTKKRLDSVTLLAPLLYPISKQEAANQINKLNDESKSILLPSDSEIDEMVADPVRLMEKMFSLLIGFSFISIREYSLALPDDMELPKE